YSEDLMGGGFRFYNPKAETICGCGNSFSVNSEQ
ncbi:MAG: iron-sulfur cluster assembly accessory protein, partial [Rivularia sp. ALOHA_DT_140]|nr:iron-sulfur cluster assembly accessory protein [Rivularia sp. ALOHA_DT_140]